PLGPLAGPSLPVPAREPAPVLERVWLASDQLSGKLLRPLLPTLLTALVTHHGLRVAPAVRTALTTASAATLDRLLRPLRRLRPRPPTLPAAWRPHRGRRWPPAGRRARPPASAATLDRLLRPLRRRRPRQPGRVARALAPLRAQVPLRTWSEWTGVRPGALQG